MSRELQVIPRTGKDEADLSVVSFAGPKSRGMMLQLTQGFGGCASLMPLKVDEVGFIQLTLDDAARLIPTLTQWVKENE